MIIKCVQSFVTFAKGVTSIGGECVTFHVTNTVQIFAASKCKSVYSKLLIDVEREDGDVSCSIHTKDFQYLLGNVSKQFNGLRFSPKGEAVQCTLWVDDEASSATTVSFRIPSLADNASTESDFDFKNCVWIEGPMYTPKDAECVWDTMKSLISRSEHVTLEQSDGSVTVKVNRKFGGLGGTRRLPLSNACKNTNIDVQITLAWKHLDFIKFMFSSTKPTMKFARNGRGIVLECILDSCRCIAIVSSIDDTV